MTGAAGSVEKHMPVVSVLIPMRNETASIERCLRAVLEQDLSDHDYEIIVIDGASTDGSPDAVRAVLEAHSPDGWRIIDNPDATTPSNLNAGLAVARGAIVCRVDARSIIPPTYLRRCVETLQQRTDVAVVGGRQIATPAADTTTAKGIARALNNRYTMGFARYRRGASSGPTDTVYLGAFRTADLRASGGWNEAFPTNQDFELNRRMSDRGTVWFDSELEVAYLPRRTLGDLWRQYRRFGVWKARYWTSSGDKPQPRQLVMLAAPPVGVLLWAVAVVTARGGRRAVIACFPALLIALVEGAGTTARVPAGAGVRVVSSMASVSTMCGWWSGAAQGWFRRGRHRYTTPGDGTTDPV